MSRAKLEQRLEVLEAQNVPAPGLSPWEIVISEVGFEALEDLGYILEMEHPEDSPEWNIIYSQPPGYVGPEWIKSGPEAARRYTLWLREALPCLKHPDTRPPRQVDGWPSYDRPKGEMDGKVFDVLLADAPNPETFERWINLLEIT